MRVLIVDDYPGAAEIASVLVEMFGHECAFTLDGASALAVAGSRTFDVAILDIGLPDMTGYDLARELRARGHSMYFAALTGWGEPRDRMASFAAGFHQHVIKPTDGVKLRDILDRASEWWRAGQVSDAPSSCPA